MSYMRPAAHFVRRVHAAAPTRTRCATRQAGTRRREEHSQRRASHNLCSILHRTRCRAGDGCAQNVGKSKPVPTVRTVNYASPDRCGAAISNANRTPLAQAPLGRAGYLRRRRRRQWGSAVLTSAELSMKFDTAMTPHLPCSVHGAAPTRIVPRKPSCPKGPPRDSSRACPTAAHKRQAPAAGAVRRACR